MENKLSIHVTIAERQYPLKIDRSDEERIRKAAKTINDKVSQYKQRYSTKDAQDFLAMTALQIAIQNFEIAENTDTQPIVDELKQLNDEIDHFLNEQE
ncbi:MAG: cell division protein ZapA [Bacteroidota bacterium]|nr:cell division protein ZapA [Bacteroidota bacterium]MDP4204925.1 cell division protein ZapA [Bacteroidota bacterium]